MENTTFGMLDMKGKSLLHPRNKNNLHNIQEASMVGDVGGRSLEDLCNLGWEEILTPIPND